MSYLNALIANYGQSEIGHAMDLGPSPVGLVQKKGEYTVCGRCHEDLDPHIKPIVVVCVTRNQDHRILHCCHRACIFQVPPQRNHDVVAPEILPGELNETRAGDCPTCHGVVLRYFWRIEEEGVGKTRNFYIPRYAHRTSIKTVAVALNCLQWAFVMPFVSILWLVEKVSRFVLDVFQKTLGRDHWINKTIVWTGLVICIAKGIPIIFPVVALIGVPLLLAGSEVVSRRIRPYLVPSNTPCAIIENRTV